jgi:hypothetical protein
VKASFLSAEPRAATRSTGGSGYTGSAPPSLSSQPSRSRSSSFYGGQSMPKKRAKKRSRSRGGYYNEGCPCSGRQICIGPRGGRYCITSGGNKRYGV